MAVDTAPGEQYIQGKEVSFSEVKATAHVPGGESFEMTDWKDITWKTAVTVGKTRSRGTPNRRTSGISDFTAAAIFYRGGKIAVINQLAIIAEANDLIRDGDMVMWGMVEFDLEITFSYPGEDQISTIVLEGCRFIDDDEKSSEGEAPQEAALTIDPMNIYELINGRKCVLR